MVGVSVLLLAACGSDDEDSDATTTTAAAAAAATPTSGATTSSGSSAPTTSGSTDPLGEKNEATGDPVIIGLVSSEESANSKRSEAGMNMAVEYANDYLGGIAGRPIELRICRGISTPAGAQDCANQMVNDQVAAVVLPTSGQPTMVPILTGAGIPYVTVAASAPEELTTPGAFSITGGFPTTMAAFASLARDSGLKKFALVGIDSPAIAQGATALGQMVFPKVDVEFAFIPAPFGVADMTPQLQAAVNDGAEALGVLGDITFCTSFLQAYQTLALDVPMYLVSLCIDPSTVEAYGDVMDGSVMIGSIASEGNDSDVKLYGAIAEKYGDNVEVNPADNPTAAAGTAVVLSFVNLLKDLRGDVTPATVLAQIKAAKQAHLFLGGGATLTCDGTAVAVFPSVCSGFMLASTVDSEGKLHDTELITAGSLYDP